MAHIADCLASTEYGLNNFIAKELTPQSSMESLQLQHTEENEKYVWRLHQPTEPRKYQLFPSKTKLSIKTPEPEQLPQGQLKKSKSKEQTLNRRRKASVPELGPMTTVQEVAMDSPTIPGRPPLHERSSSAPGHGWRHNVFGESMISLIAGQPIEEKPENLPGTPWPPGSPEETRASHSTSKATPTQSTRVPISPKLLKKLIIPDTTIQVPEYLISRCQSARPGNNEEAPEVPPKSARMFAGRRSPLPHTPANNSNTSSNTDLSATKAPNTAPAGRTETKPWDTPISATPTSAPGHCRNQSEQPASRVQYQIGHRREQSETSIMDRGRPKKRGAIIEISRKPSKKLIKKEIETTKVSRELTEEEKAFATLPAGFRAVDADLNLDSQDIDSLRQQAVGQAAKFEVLSVRDVEILSRELRVLDERCEYLRKTYRSLRAGRRNLHERICSYLRSPRVARFSSAAILKQEEALAELDTSIDDWVSKLEQAENRRTRVRQKLLEHVAAAVTLNSPASSSSSSTAPPLNMSHKNHRFINESHNHNINTPPRSPTKMGSSLSPPRSPITTACNESSSSSPNKHHQYHQQQNTTAITNTSDNSSSTPLLSQSPQRLAEQIRISSPPLDARTSLQSIKIYADSDVYALLGAVEKEINRMGELEDSSSADSESVSAESLKRGESPFGLLSSATYEAAATQQKVVA